MTGFSLNDVAVFTNSTGSRVVKVIEVLDFDPTRDYIVHVVGGTAWFARDDELQPLPEGAPAFGTEAHVLVVNAGRTGAIVCPEFRGGLFGYWIDLDDTGEHVWVPAEILRHAAAEQATKHIQNRTETTPREATTREPS